MEIYSNKSSPFVRWIFATVFLVLFIVLASLVANGKVESLDNPFITIFEAMRDPFVTSVTKGITFFANTLTIILLCLFLLFLPSRMFFGAPVILITAVTALINLILKLIFARERPDEDLRLVEASGYSFPSGHTVTSLVFYISLMILLRRYFTLRGQNSIATIITVIFSTLAVLIGFSRIYLGVHYPTDVFAGWLLGGIFLIVGVTLYDYMYPVKFLISYDGPAWGYIKKRKPWRKPLNKKGTDEMVDFPKFKSAWRKPKVSSKAEREAAKEAEREEERIRAEKAASLNDAPIMRASQSKPPQNNASMSESPFVRDFQNRASKNKEAQSRTSPEETPPQIPAVLIKIQDTVKNFIKKFFS